MLEFGINDKIVKMIRKMYTESWGNFDELQDPKKLISTTECMRQGWSYSTLKFISCQTT